MLVLRLVECRGDDVFLNLLGDLVLLHLQHVAQWTYFIIHLLQVLHIYFQFVAVEA